MLIQKISSNHLKEISKLKLKKYRDESRHFLIETEKVLIEAVNSDWNIKEIYITSKFLESKSSLLNKLSDKKLKVFELSEIQFKKISSEVTPQGIGALVEVKELKLNHLLQNFPDTILFFENISDPNNLGAILRTADWFGIKWIVLSKGSVDFTNPKVVRSSMGSIFHLNLIVETELENVLKQIKQVGYKIYSTATTGKDVTKINFVNRVAFIFGNESKGISEVVKDLSDEIISIPRVGKAESLNVTISASLIVYENWRSLRSKKF